MHENMNSRTQKIKKINIKAHKDFNVVWLIMPTSMDEREFFPYSKNTEYKIGVSKYYDN